MNRLLVRLALPLLLIATLPTGANRAWAEQPATHRPQKPAHHPHKPLETHKPPAKPPIITPKPASSNQPAPHKPTPRKPASGKPAKPTPVAAPPPAPEPEKPAEPTKGSNTGQPIPRFATLRSDDVNLRSGPGTRYPIQWVYKRKDLPVQIEREFEVWRLVRDQEGTKGWVHQAVLAPRRTGIVVGAEATLRHDPSPDAAPVARLKPGVIVRLRNCAQGADWCQAQIQDYRGWINRTAIWGTFPGEPIQ